MSIALISIILLSATALAASTTKSTNAPAPVAAFTAYPTSGDAPLSVKFTDKSTGSPIEWKWNFGDGSEIIDGNTSDYKNPTHVYSKAGTYTVKETAINAVGRNTVTKSNYIKITNAPAPVAAFTAYPTSGNAPLSVKFTDKSTGSPIEWKWNFGDGSKIIDGNTSDYKNPTHVYSKAGTYTVKETAINAVGRNTVTKSNYIKITNAPAPVAAFTAYPTSGDAPLSVKFTDKSTGSPIEWKWNFGDGSEIIDGNTSDYKNPTHVYSKAGTYTVKETAINAVGRNTVTKSNYIKITNAPAPVAAFTAYPTSGNAPLSVKFTDKSTGSPIEWKWNFGDGSKIIDGNTSDYKNPTHVYSKAGTYTVKETAINAVGRNTVTKSNYITVK
jgi:PKD repeat protein